MKNKNKGKENIIGKIIYGFTLFMPLLAIISTILINTFNLTSKTEIKYQYETNEVNTINDLKIGNIYHLTFKTTDRPTQTERLYVEKVYNLDLSQNADAYGTPTQSQLPNFAFTQNNTFYYFYTYNAYYYGYQLTNNFECDIVYNGNSNFTKISYLTKCKNIPIKETDNINSQEVFYNAIDKVQESPLFNWSSNTAMYSVLETTCTTLGIETTFIPFIFAYWLLVSIIYILYDIALVGIHIVHNKIHSLEESI